MSYNIEVNHNIHTSTTENSWLVIKRFGLTHKMKHTATHGTTLPSSYVTKPSYLLITQMWQSTSHHSKF
jgi:hypothetical protein